MNQLYVICIIFSLQLYKIGGFLEVSKMNSKFTVKWTLNFKDFIVPERASRDCSCYQKALVHFSDVKNLAFYLCLYSDSHDLRLRLLPELPYLNISDVVYLENALIYTPHFIYELKRSSGENLPLLSTSRKARERIWSSELDWLEKATIHCMINVKTEVETTLSKDHAQCNSYILVTNSTRDVEELCYDTGTKGDFIDEYVYGGQIPSMSTTRAIAIIRDHTNRVQDLGAPELMQWSLHYVNTYITSENVIEILNLALEKNMDILRDKCLNYLKNKCIISENS